ncbi:class II glutamine amidotransferase [uncultured Methanobrevibacter sp.]|uniref:class II glutamine amidotransferase n=1 Tax=uncultured Methanobrevibacter sp. TaxID=253161 RepID=UPI0025E0CCC6|nr:class II glutamine amidotransferase [uncultured Methanobrevibacter sp.]
MCEIFCINSKEPHEVNECLQCFYEHSDEHPDGWGLANLANGKFQIEKEPIKAKCSKQLKKILSNPIISKNVFAHIRLATVGEIISVNCHPFYEIDSNKRSWILIHNGTIFDYSPLDKYKDKQKGDTDSERILLYIIDKVDEFEKEKGKLSSIKERFNLLSKIIRDLSKKNKLNLMICDGDLTYIHTNMKNSLYYLKNDEDFIVSSTPLNQDKNWKPVELNKLFGLIDGNIIFESKKHENVYIETEENRKKFEEFNKSLKRVEY